MKERSLTYRLPPCPSYDIEGTECWLEDMASKGLLLTEDGIFFGFAQFEKTAPRSVRYRMEAAPRNTSMWAADGGNPDRDAVELSRDLGWTYVATRDQFYIYRTDDEAIPELNTDPAVQALALEKIRKRERGSIIGDILWLIVYPLIFMNFAPLLTLYDVGTWFSLYAVLLLIWLFTETLARTLHLWKLRKRLERNGTLNHRKSWKERAVWYQWLPIARTAAIILWVILLLCHWSADVLDEGKIPLSEYTGDVPFATVADYAPGGTYTSRSYSFSNTVEDWSDPLAPRLMDWVEHAVVKTIDGKEYEIGLYADYFETVSPVLAKEVVREYLRQDKRDKNYEPMEIPENGLDEAYMYTDSIHMPTLLLRKGNTVLRISYHQTGDDRLAAADWAKLVISTFDEKN